MVYRQKSTRDVVCRNAAGMRRRIRTGLLVGAIVITLAGGLTGCFNFIFGPTEDDVTPDVSSLPPYSHDEVATSVALTETIPSGETDNYYFNEVKTNSSGVSETFNLTINAGTSTVPRVYLQFSNGDGMVSEVPKITPATTASSHSTEHLHEESAGHAGHDHDDHDHDDVVSYDTEPYRVHADLEKMRADSIKLLRAGQSSASSAGASASLRNVAPTPILRNTVDDDVNFYLPIGGTTESFTARAVSTDGTWTAVVWIPDTAFTGCTAGDECLAELLTTARAQDIANTFLQSGNDNDMFDWTINLIGDPWGAHTGFSNLIPSTTRQIDIILYDIGDNRYARGPHIVGYYSSLNNFTASANCGTRCSNERLIFYMDAAWAQFDESTREGISAERYYNIFLSTLGHELQHMVNFYQRAVLDSTSGSISGDPAWLNEQFSVIMEDILGYKLAYGRNAPTTAVDSRGIDVLSATNGGLSPGAFPICGGRPKGFASQSYYGVSRWEGEIVNYAVNFSFSSFLLRNYGGTGGASAYLSAAYDSLNNGFGAITAGLAAGTSGTADTEADVISKWGTAVILSNDSGRPAGYRFNNGSTGFNTTVTVNSNTFTYNLGSINYFNYAEDGCAADSEREGALRFFNDSASIYNTLRNQQHGHSNIIYLAGEDMTGSSTYKITLPAGGRLTLVAHRTLGASAGDGTAFNPVYF